MAAQSNPPANFGYTWGFADNSRADGNVVEISPSINYTVSEAVSSNLIFLKIFSFVPGAGHFHFSLICFQAGTEIFFLIKYMNSAVIAIRRRRL